VLSWLSPALLDEMDSLLPCYELTGDSSTVVHFRGGESSAEAIEVELLPGTVISCTQARISTCMVRHVGALKSLARQSDADILSVPREK
jgi:hypothetical protein